MFSLPFLVVGMLSVIVIAVNLPYGGNLSYTGMCFRKQRGLLYFTCAYQRDMQLAISMVVW